MKNLWNALRKLDFTTLFRTLTDDPWIGLFRYFFVGGGAFLIDFASYFLLTRLGVSYLLAGVLAFTVSFVFNFLVSRLLIFHPKNSRKKVAAEIAKVLAVALVGLLLTEVLLFICVQALQTGRLIGKVIASAVVLVWNYLGRRWFVYRQSPINYKKFFKTALKLSITIVLCIVIGMAALIGAYSIPTDSIRNHIGDSIPTLENEGVYPSLNPHTASQLDNWTDAIMLHSASHPLSGNPIRDAVFVNRYECNDAANPLDSLLADYNNTGRPMDTVSYSRYWHGYQVVLKPLLTHFSYDEIRTINTFIQWALILFLVALLIEKKMYLYIIPVLFLIGFQQMSTTVLSLQFSNVFYIYIIGMIVLLCFYERWKHTTKMAIFFTLLGAATAFLDLLTYPLVTFAIPVTLYMVLEKKQTLIEQIKTVVGSGLAWLFGFAGMWIGKGAIGTLLTGENIFVNMMAAVNNKVMTMPEDNIPITPHAVMKLNWETFIRSDFYNYAILFCLLFFFLIVLRSFKTKRLTHLWNNMGFVLVSFAPVCWYTLLKRHSHVHFWFTYREYLILLFALSVMLVKAYIDSRQIAAEPKKHFLQN